MSPKLPHLFPPARASRWHPVLTLWHRPARPLLHTEPGQPSGTRILPSTCFPSLGPKATSHLWEPGVPGGQSRDQAAEGGRGDDTPQLDGGTLSPGENSWALSSVAHSEDSPAPARKHRLSLIRARRVNQGKQSRREGSSPGRSGQPALDRPGLRGASWKHQRLPHEGARVCRALWGAQGWASRCRSGASPQEACEEFAL